MLVEFKEFPMPPSFNHAHINLARGGRAKGKGYHEFIKAVEFWRMVNFHTVSRSRELKIVRDEGKRLFLDKTFFFPRDKLIMQNDSGPKAKEQKKAGDPKKLDVSNRIKILEDSICALIGIDDAWVTDGAYRLRCTTPKLIEGGLVLNPEYVNVKISTISW